MIQLSDEMARVIREASEELIAEYCDVFAGEWSVDASQNKVVTKLRDAVKVLS